MTEAEVEPIVVILSDEDTRWENVTVYAVNA